MEAYLRANHPPRYMQRLREIEDSFRVHRRRLEAAYLALGDACGDDADLFADRWQVTAHAWPFGALNELIREHNEWYPVEANLPMDPRTRDYVAVHGQSYRRKELGPEWVLEHFPLRPNGSLKRPRVPRRVPREPR